MRIGAGENVNEKTWGVWMQLHVKQEINAELCTFDVIPLGVAHTMKLSCGHRCERNCHSSACPDAKDCAATVSVSCPCKRIKKGVPCNRVKQQPVDCNEACQRKRAEEKKVRIQLLYELTKVFRFLDPDTAVQLLGLGVLILRAIAPRVSLSNYFIRPSFFVFLSLSLQLKEEKERVLREEEERRNRIELEQFQRKFDKGRNKEGEGRRRRELAVAAPSRPAYHYVLAGAVPLVAILLALWWLNNKG